MLVKRFYCQAGAVEERELFEVTDDDLTCSKLITFHDCATPNRGRTYSEWTITKETLIRIFEQVNLFCISW
ncbi:hypothetical protein QP393_09155, partial [Lactobacillus gasseri]